LKESGQSYSFYMTIPLCILDPDVKNELVNSKKITTSCHVPKGSGVIFSEDDEVLPCNHFTDVSYGKLGKDFRTAEEFKVFWNSEESLQFRKEFNSFPHANCSTCADWAVCGGGCKIKWMYYDPKDYIGKRRE
jgi:radical SAM protein with 4Fe4S-binding SPASM domain